MVVVGVAAVVAAVTVKTAAVGVAVSQWHQPGGDCKMEMAVAVIVAVIAAVIVEVAVVVEEVAGLTADIVMA